MGAYPPDFADWSEDKRNDFFKTEADRYEAAKGGASGKRAKAAPHKNGEDETLPDLGADLDDGGIPPAFCDEALALRFAERHAANLRYVAAWGKWLSWTGTLWRFDSTLSAFDKVRATCRHAASTCNKPKVASAVASGKAVAAVERLARYDRRLAATDDQWDADPWLLNTPEGVVDLKTGALRPHRPDDYMTKRAGL